MKNQAVAHLTEKNDWKSDNKNKNEFVDSIFNFKALCEELLTLRLTSRAEVYIHLIILAEVSTSTDGTYHGSKRALTLKLVYCIQ